MPVAVETNHNQQTIAAIPMHRFYVPANRISGDRVSFETDQRRQIRNVLRLRPGDLVAVLDGSGREYATRIETLDERQALGRILETKSPAAEPHVRLTLVQGLPKGEKVALILQKCTEIGVAEFLLVETARSVPRIPSGKMPGRLERWRAIVREAVEQSGRTRPPSVKGVIPLADALSRTRNCDARIIAWEEEKGPSLSSTLPGLAGAREIACFVGPEGGFTAEEVAAARAEGVTPVSLGPRILRAETAAIVGAALIIYGLERQPAEDNRP